MHEWMVQYCGSACVDLVEFANALCSRVGLVINTFQAVCGQVCVNLSCDQMCVPEKFLHAPEISPSIEHVGGKAVA